ncbi:MAG TPA: tetratricopeptide repeat protein [Terriglobales bacterium]
MNWFARIALVLLILSCTAGCRRSPQQKYAKFIETGKQHFEKRDYSRALLEFKNASQVYPREAEPYYRLSLVALATGDLANGVAYLRKTTELNPKHKEAQLKLVELLTISKNKEVLEEAEKRVREVLANSPMDADALSALAVAEWKLGKQEEAEEHLEQAFEKSPQNLKSSFNLAKLKLAQKDTSGAEQVLKKVAEANSDTVAPLVALGAFYASTGRPADAEQQYRRALQIDPKNGLVIVSLAGMKLRAGLKDEAEQLYKQASALPDPQYKPVHASFLFLSGQRDLAIAEFEKLAKADPADRKARTRLISAYLATNRLPDAEQVLRAALEKNPKDLDALLQRSQIYLRTGKYGEAQADMTRLLKFEPNSAMVHYLMAKVHQSKGAKLRQREELGEAVRLDATFLPARMELAQLLTFSSSPKSALDLLNEAPEAQKNMLPVLVQQNWAHLVLGNRAEAGKGIQRALGMGKSADLLLQQGVFRMTQQDHSGARQSFEEALKLNPEDLNALSALVQTYAAQKQIPAAVQKVREYASQRPKSAPLQQFLGQLLAQSGDRPEARKAFHAAKAANPGFTISDVALAQLDILDGKLDEARARLSTLISSNPAEVRARLLLGNLEQRASNYTEAVEQYRKAVELDDQNFLALNNLAYLLAEYGKQADEALKLAHRAKDLAPTNANILDTLGWIYYRKGLWATAIQHLEQAVSKEPTGLRKSHLALAYIKSGDRKRGRDMIDAALKMDPKLSESRSFQELLAEAR